MDHMPLYYSMALGAGETTLLRLTNAYAMLDNGGHWLLPSVIDAVQDRTGRVIYQKGVKKGGPKGDPKGDIDCAACFVAVAAAPGSASDTGALYRPAGPPDPASIAVPNATYADNAVIYKPAKPDPLVTPEADSEIVAMMQGVVERGTGTAVKAVGKPLAGKTGTTSDWFDAWFVGFSPDLVAGVFVGFDDPRTLGSGETGGHVAAPIFRDFMAAALKDAPAKPFPVAPGAALMASARTSGAAAAREDPANPDEDDPDPDDRAAADPDDRGDTMQGQTGRRSRDYAVPATPDYALPSWVSPTWPAYASPRGRGYAAAQAPDDASPGAPRVPGYPWPGYAPGYAAPPRYPLPAWARPSGGTGGLY
jgi:penicillin-binding protein 1A